MPVRIRITLLFVAIVSVILGIVCGGIYFFSYAAREQTIKTRLTNRSITTARLLARKEIFDQRIVQQIDSLTTLSLKRKIVKAFDYQNTVIYAYSDVRGDSIKVPDVILDDARVKGSRYFRYNGKDAVAYHYSDKNARLVVVSAADDVEGKKSLEELINILWISFLGGNAVVMIAGYIFSAGLLRPIKKITADVEEISAQNLARRIKTGNSKDEWNHLANTLNELLNRLQESFLLQRIFISNASHELSTPLTAISSQLEVSLQRNREASEYKHVLQSIDQDVRHMIKLTQTLLEFAKASGNIGGLEIHPIRMDEIILRLPSEMAKVNPLYNVTIVFNDLPEDEHELLVFGNEALLLTAIRNIVLNACKYSDDHQATVHLQVDGSGIIIIISDKGKGIPENELKTIFQPFYRVEENIASEGFGLGLSLSDRIIKIHKGTIEVSSKVMEGTTFIISFPSSAKM